MYTASTLLACYFNLDLIFIWIFIKRYFRYSHNQKDSYYLINIFEFEVLRLFSALLNRDVFELGHLPSFICSISFLRYLFSLVRSLQNLLAGRFMLFMSICHIRFPESHQNHIKLHQSKLCSVLLITECYRKSVSWRFWKTNSFIIITDILEELQ